MPAFDNMQYVNVLGYLKTDYDDYVLLKKQTSHEVPLVGDKDKDKKIIKWVSIFEDVISRTFGSKVPLVYILRENADIPDVGDDPLTKNTHYGASGYMLGELINCLPHAVQFF